jgi:hypothetical protein
MRWIKRLLGIKTREALRFVTYAEADALIKQGWTIAKEEDTNHIPGMVYLELLKGA